MRVGLLLAAIAAVPVGTVAWFVTGMIAGSHDSACQGELPAQLSYGASTLALALAFAAIAAALGPWARGGWRMLGAFAVLLAVATVLAAWC